MKILLIHFDSKGLAHDAQVLSEYILQIAALLSLNIHIQKLAVHSDIINEDDNSLLVRIESKPDVVIHIQDIYKTNLSYEEAIHILVPNPDWTDGFTGERLHHMHQVWHKTKFSLIVFNKAFGGQSEQRYIGFTSLDYGFRIKNFSSVAHFKGKAVARNSGKIHNIWKRRTDFPTLRFSFYSTHYEFNFFTFNEWLKCRNVELKCGFSTDDEYFKDLSESGIHICTGEIEGFGHYINECRMMGGVPIIINGFPMRELVSETSGYLVEPVHSEIRGMGIRYKITEQDLEKCLERVVSEPYSNLVAKGANARLRYEIDRDEFVSNLTEAVKGLHARMN
jgi:hypothetical protein